MKNSKLFIILFLIIGTAKSQQNFTLYNMPSIPQSNLLNPAMLPDCKWHVGIPVINSTYFQYSNGGFNLNKIFNAMEPINADSNQLNLNKVLDIFNKKNYIAFKSQISWLSGGVKLLKHHYLHFSLQEKAQIRLSIPKDLFTFIIDGNGGPNLGETFDFDFKINAMQYREYALGYAYTLANKLTVGGRLKYLQGFNILDTKSAKLSVTTDPNDFSYLLKSNIELNAASTLGQIIQTDPNQTFDPQPRNLFRTKNTGMAIDLGANYVFNDKLSFNASLLDLGFITWRQNTVTIKSQNPNSSFRYNGVKVTSSDTNSDFGQYFQTIGDSVLKTFKVDTFHRNFTTGLSAEFFLGANYIFSKRIKFGALLYGDFYNRRFYPGLTLNMGYKLGKVLSINVSNTMYNRSIINIGLGGSINTGAFQVYSVMDNFLFPFVPTSIKNFSWRFGTNITIGRDRLNPKNEKSNAVEIDPTSN